MTERCLILALNGGPRSGANKDDYLSRATIASTRNREILRKAKEKPCADCGIQYPFYVMQFDHLKDKLFDLSQAGATSVKRLLAEIAKCEIVCANCHAERTYQRLKLQYLKTLVAGG